MSANSSIAGMVRSISLRESPSSDPLRYAFSRPLKSGWNPAPISRSAVTRPFTSSLPLAGGSGLVVNVPGEVWSRGKHKTSQSDGAFPMLQHPSGRVGGQQIDRADYVGFESLDPSQLCPALKPGDLALEVRKEVAVQPDPARHAMGSARPRIA